MLAIRRTAGVTAGRTAGFTRPPGTRSGQGGENASALLTRTTVHTVFSLSRLHGG